MIRRLLSLFDRLLKVRKGDFGVIREYLKLCIQIGSVKNFYRVFIKNTKFFGQRLDYWLIAVYYEFEVRRNIFKARELFHKALALNNNQLEFLLEYMDFEAQFFKLIEERQQYLLQQTAKKVSKPKKELIDGDNQDQIESEAEEVIEFEDEDDSEVSQKMEEEDDNPAPNMEDLSVSKTPIFDGIVRKMLLLLQNEEKPSVDVKSIVERALEIYGNAMKTRTEVFAELEQFYMTKYNTSLYSEATLSYFFNNTPASLPSEFIGLSMEDNLALLTQLLKTKAQKVNLKNLAHFIDEAVKSMNLRNLIANITLFDSIVNLFIEEGLGAVSNGLLAFMQANKSNVDCFRLLMKLEQDNTKALKLLRDSIAKLAASAKAEKTNTEAIAHKGTLIDAYLSRLELTPGALEDLTVQTVDELIKLASLKKELLSLIADYFINWISSGKINKPAVNAHIISKFVGIKNYSPAQIIIYALNNNLLAQKEVLFEEFLRYNPQEIELWKLYMLFLKKLTRVDKLEKTYVDGLRTLMGDKKSEWIAFYKLIN